MPKPTMDESKINQTNWDKIWNSIRNIDIRININHKSANRQKLISIDRAKQIKSAFKFAYDNYAKYALGHDGIDPINGKANDVWRGMAATMIDALDTMLLMQLFEEYDAAMNALQNVSFDSDAKVSFFETTIRHLGGLLGAYTLNQQILDKSEYERLLLSKATILSNNLFAAFSNPLGIPKSMINLKTGASENYGWTSGQSVLAEVASNQLEFYAMSRHLQKDEYYVRSMNVYKVLADAQNPLFARLIDPQTGDSKGGYYTLGGMSDSAYEYMLKLWILTGYKNKLAIKMYVQSVDAANEELLRMIHDKKRRDEPYYFYGDKSWNSFYGTMEHLVCFMPGALALGSYHAMLIEQEYDESALTKYERQLITDRDKHLKLAHVLLESCYSLYREMPTGLAPESISFDEHSWSVKESKYQLRPETLESLFILYSLTGKEEYREWAWKIFKAIETHCKTKYAFSGLVDVRRVDAGYDDQMQSYVMAETFKYLYLMFDARAAASIPLDQYVFNTEAHPIRIDT